MAKKQLYRLVVTLTSDLSGEKAQGAKSCFKVAPKSSGRITIKDVGNCTLSLVGLNFVKRIYYPCTIDADLSLSGSLPPMETIRSAFVGASVNLEAVCYDTDDEEFDEKTAVTHASAYLVSNCTVEYRRNAVDASDSLYLSLQIKSPDYLLEGREYSRVYGGERFSTIMLEGMKAVGIEGCLNKNLRYLSHDRNKTEKNKDGGTVSKTVTDEFLHPYLVQYNETFYSFARRVANRCGEFLFYENGKLNLGLDKSSDTAKSVSGFASVRLHNAKRNLPSSGELFCFHRNPVTGSLSKQSSGAGITSGTNFGAYNSEGVEEEYLTPIQSTDYDNYMDEYNARFYWTTDAFTVMFGSASIIQAIIGASFTILQHVATAKSICSEQEDTYKKNFFDGKSAYYGSSADPAKFKAFYDVSEGGKADDVKSFAQYSTHSSQNTSAIKRDLDNSLYSLVRDTQEKIWDFAVEIDFGTSLTGICLGDRITLGSGNVPGLSQKYDGEEYLVVEVSGGDVNDSSKGWKESLKVVAVRDFKTKSKDASGTEHTNPALPPSIDEDIVRRSGPQTAVISTPSGDPNRLGRVRIRYCWEKDTDAQSPWIRVSSALANRKETGTYFKPAKGDEVLVDFECGNIERPYVVGYLYNSSHPTKYGTVAFNDVISNNSGQVIRSMECDDAALIAGGMFPGIALLQSLFGFNWSSDTEACRYLSGFTELRDKYGLFDIKMSTPDRKISVKSPVGSVEVSAFTGIKINAPHGDVNIVGKNVSISAGNNLSLSSGTNIVNKIQSGSENNTDTFLKALGGAGQMLLGHIVDISLIRCLVEMFLLPVAGNLSIKSNRHLLLAAGEGEPQIPFDSYTDGRDKERWWMDDENDSYWMQATQHGVEYLCARMDETYRQEVQAMHTLLPAKNALLQFDQALKDNSKYRLTNVIDEAFKAGEKQAPTAVGNNEAENFAQQNAKTDDPAQQLNISANCMTISENALRVFTDADILSKIHGFKCIIDGIIEDNFSPAIKSVLDFLRQQNDTILGPLKISKESVMDDGFVKPTPQEFLLVKRKIVWAYLKYMSSKNQLTVPDLGGDDDYKDLEGEHNWAASLAGISKKEKTDDGILLSAIKAAFYDKVISPVGSPVYDRTSWAGNDTGKILISQGKDSTIEINGEGTFIEHGNATLPAIVKVCKSSGIPAYVPQDNPPLGAIPVLAAQNPVVEVQGDAD